MTTMAVEEANCERELPKEIEIEWETPLNPPKPEDYIFYDGRRMVRPYYFEFIAHVNKRWAGKKVVDVFSHEFRQRPHEYYVEAVKSGRIRVDGKFVAIGYVVQGGQKLSHFVHRHEPPVMVERVVILEEGCDVVTVCKPASVPVHPCGQYRKNTVMGILQAEHGLAPLFPIHRLDRLVSGLLIFARNASTADRFREEIEAGKVQKEYVAKIRGVFPKEEVEVDADVAYDAREGRSTTQVSNGDKEKSINGKTACTRFTRLGTDGVFSVVKCVPVTGRTHQIRVHLQHLGHPIANDALYSHENPPSRTRKETSADRAAKVSQIPTTDMDESKLALRSVSEQCNSSEESSLLSNEDLDLESSQRGSQLRNNVNSILEGTNKKQKSEGNSIVGMRPYQCSARDSCNNFQEGSINTNQRLNTDNSEKLELDFSMDSMCTNCPNVAPSGYDDHEEALWLHCVRYSGPSWVYECPLPKWAFI